MLILCPHCLVTVVALGKRCGCVSVSLLVAHRDLKNGVDSLQLYRCCLFLVL